MTEKRFTALGSTHLKDNETGKEYYAPCEWDLLDLLNALHKENQHFKEAFEKTMEDAFDRNMDSKIAEEVIDYIHISFYEFLKLEGVE